MLVRANNSKLLKGLAPQIGFEPTTLRLTEAPPQIDRVRPSAMKIMRLSNLRPASDQASIAVARRKRWWIASFSRGSVTIHVTANGASNRPPFAVRE